MDSYANRERWLVGLGLAVLTLVALISLVLMLWIVRERQAAQFPGARLVSDHNIYTGFPFIHLRRDTSYRTIADFTTVYNWYSNGFNLGEERLAQSQCVCLFRSTTRLAIRQEMSVTLCDTSSGRLIFVQRSISLRYR